ncbi:YVTN family beta-propeller protein [Keratinibaculum paraultunense]|uniref:YVTN family beta-propeller protein n=1 Tax=Keratinibaculum paraultunense TaxID=1278232 RepID=A0A4R3L2X3_9FIRM|nr:YncE family protein [Keratinibaculum paraultunense]QQY80351.1 YncE family protein [Keratinibaculum paraultunense]TCS90875.1 YVTN family beta-propeller protein [Keratinibaculum paraultunense]
MKLKEKLIIANTGDDTLTCINLLDKKVDKIIYLRETINNGTNTMLNVPSIGPWDMIYDGYKFVYCTNAYDNSIFKIDIISGNLVDKLYVGSFPTSIKAFDDHIFIVNSDSNSISVVDEKEFYLIENIPVGEKPIDIEIDEIQKKLYIANSNGSSINIIDLDEYKNQTIKLKNNPLKIIIEDEYMYILYSVNNGTINNSNISIMNLKNYSEEEIFQLKGIFTTMLKLNDKEIVFITSIDEGYICRLDIEKRNLLSKTKLMGMPNRIKWDRDNTIFITDIANDILYFFDIKENNLTDYIKVGKEPGGILII